MDKTFIDPNSAQGDNNQNANDQTRVENQQSSNQNQESPIGEDKNRIVLNNVTKSQKEKILALGGAGLIGAIGGAGAFAFLSFVDNSANPTPPEPDPVEPDPVDPIEPDPVIIYTEAPFAHNVNDDMSFGDAFGAARADVGPGGFFEWHGNTYNTYYKEEWDLLSPDEKDEFLSSVDNFDTDDMDAETDIANGDIDPNIDDANDQTNESDNDQSQEDHQTDDEVVESEIADNNFEIHADTVNIYTDSDGNPVEVEVAQDNPEIIADPEITPSSGGSSEPDMVITEADYIETADLDGDGYVDVALVDADGNEMPDIVVDLDADGEMDVLILDVDPETGVTGYEEMVYLDDSNEMDNTYASRDDVDDYNDADINPDQDIDNDYDMTDMA